MDTGSTSEVVESLLTRAKSGDRSAEGELFEYLLVRFGLFARHRIRDRQAAEDVASQACKVVYEKYRRETFEVSFEAWSWGVLRMMIRDHFHRLEIERGRIVSEPVSDREAGSPDIDPTLEMSLAKCLKKIGAVNRRYARILNLVYLGYKTDEICARLGLERNGYYVALHRGRSMLKACLEASSEWDKTNE